MCVCVKCLVCYITKNARRTEIPKAEKVRAWGVGLHHVSHSFTLLQAAHRLTSPTVSYICLVFQLRNVYLLCPAYPLTYFSAVRFLLLVLLHTAYQTKSEGTSALSVRGTKGRGKYPDSSAETSPCACGCCGRKPSSVGCRSQTLWRLGASSFDSLGSPCYTKGREIYNNPPTIFLSVQ